MIVRLRTAVVADNAVSREKDSKDSSVVIRDNRSKDRDVIIGGRLVAGC